MVTVFRNQKIKMRVPVYTSKPVCQETVPKVLAVCWVKKQTERNKQTNKKPSSQL